MFTSILFFENNDQTRILLCSPLRAEKRLGEALQNFLGLRIELPIVEVGSQPGQGGTEGAQVESGHGTRSTTVTAKPRQVKRLNICVASQGYPEFVFARPSVSDIYMYIYIIGLLCICRRLRPSIGHFEFF